MAFNATAGRSGEFHYLVEICLDSTTLRYADADLSIKMGTLTGAFFEGRLPRSGELVRDLGTFLEAREQINTYSLIVDNSDGTLGTVLFNATFGNRPVRVWLGEGEDLDDYSLAFVGNIDFPGGVEFDDEQAFIEVVDKRVKDRRVLPLSTEKYTPERYPRLEPRAKTYPIPLLYGNWSSAAGSGVSIPCVCVDTDALTFKVAGHSIYSIDRYLLNAAVLNSKSQIKNVSLSQATFQLSAVAYDATSDTVSVNCGGYYDGGGLIQAPSPMLKHVLITQLGLSSTDLNVTAFDTMHTHTSDVKLRRYISEETQSDVMITELLNETQTDLRFVNGKYSPKYRYLDPGTERFDVLDPDIVLRREDQEAYDFKVTFDPDRMYTNCIPARYQWDPIDTKFLSATTQSSTEAINRDGTKVERTMDFMWMWDQTQVEERIARELVLFSVQPVHVSFRASKRLLLHDLADQIDVTHGPFVAESFQIRRIELDLGSMTPRVYGYNIFSDLWGSWTEDSAPNWSSATEAQRREQGFWTDDDGLADPSDPNSDMSRWF